MANIRETRRSLLDPETLRCLFRDLEATDVDELEVATASSRLYLRREPSRRAAGHPLSHHTQGAPAPSRPGPTAAGVPVVAPLTGVFSSRPKPEQPPFVVTGDMIEVGQVVGLIETMKIFNEVTADVAGEVLSVAASEGELVEAGHPLLYVRPRQQGAVA